MRNEFYIYAAATLIGCPIYFTLSGILTIAGIVMTIIFSFCWPVLLLGCIMLILCFYILFGQKRTLTKVKFTNDTIFIKRLNKLLFSIDWSDISEVNANTLYAPFIWNAQYLTFIAGNKRINLVLTKKMYKTIMLLCPYSSIKNEINNIEYFKWLHKNKT